MEQPADLLVDAVRALASVCDGAQDEDGRGFNKGDAFLGRRLAATEPSLWRTADRATLHHLLRKYRGQLSAFGIDYDAIPVPVVDEAHDRSAPVLATFLSRAARMASGVVESSLPRRTVALSEDGKQFVLRFSYHANTVDRLRALKPDARYDVGRQLWIVKAERPSVARAILDLAADRDFVLHANAAARLAELADAPEPEAPATPTSPTTDAAPAPTAPRRTMVLSEDRLQIEIRFEFNPEVAAGLRAAVPTVQWDKTRKCWRLPTRWGSCEGLAAYLVGAGAAAGFAVDPKVTETLAHLAAAHTGLLTASRAAETTDFPRHLVPAGLSLYPYQEAGVRYALETKRVLIGDEMGLGKTVQALMTVVIAAAWPVVVVCPATVKINWYREARKWIPKDRVITVIDGTSRTAAYHADVVIVNYDVLHAHIAGLLAEQPRAVIFDEIHMVKNRKARRTTAALELAESIPYRIGLTGTAIVNRPAEIISPLKILGRIDDLGGEWFCLKRYCDGHKTAHGWDFSGASHLDELNRKMRSTCYVRREKAQVLTELPEKRRESVVLPIDNRPAYQQAVRQFAEWMRQGADSGQKAVQLKRIEALKQLSAEGKFAAAVDWIADLATDEKLIVFAHHVRIQERLAAELAERGIGVVRLAGGEDVAARQAAIDRFQTDDRIRVVVASLMGANAGWTGTAASNVVFVEFGWTPGLHAQAEDRAHRIGQRSSVTAWYLTAERTIDEDVARLIEQKRVVTDAVNIGGGDVDVSMLDALIASLMTTTDQASLLA